MNEAARENDPGRANLGPDPVATEAVVECPQCGTQLRLLRPATLHTPIACCICGASFCIQPVETAPLSAPSGGGPFNPRAFGAGNGFFAGGSRVGPAHSSAARLRAISPASRVYPADRETRPPADPPPPMSTPAPPPPVPGTRAAPGMPKPVELPEHLQRNFHTRWMESVLGAALVLLLVVAACAGGFMIIKAVWSRDAASTPSADAPAEPEAPNPGEAPAASGTTFASTPGNGSGGPLPRPDYLFGVWESRADDGSNSTFTFRPDGTALLSQAGDPPPPPSQYNYFVAENNDGLVVLELGPDFRAPGNTRLSMRFTSSDAFTLVKHVRVGIVQPGGELRYIRTGPASASPPSPAKPSVAAPVPLTVSDLKTALPPAKSP